MKDRPFYLLFYVLLIFFVFEEVNIRFPSLFSDWFVLLSPTRFILTFHTLVGIYIVSFIAFIIIQRYEEFRTHLYVSPLGRLKNWIKRTEFARYDLIHFIILSLGISFITELFFASVSEKSIFSVIPGLDIVGTFLAESPDYPATIKVGDVVSFYKFVPGPPLGALIILILRLAHSKRPHEYPGSRILLLSFYAVPVLFFINIISLSIQAMASQSLSWMTFYPTVQPLYDFFYNLIQPNYYFLYIVTWLLDWYLFSRLKMSIQGSH